MKPWRIPTLGLALLALSASPARAYLDQAALRCFEGGSTAPPENERVYGATLYTKSARNLYCRLEGNKNWNQTSPQKYYITFTVYRGEFELARDVLYSTVQPEWKELRFQGRIGVGKPRYWPGGDYRVEAWFADKMVAETRFKVLDDTDYSRLDMTPEPATVKLLADFAAKYGIPIELPSRPFTTCSKILACNHGDYPLPSDVDRYAPIVVQELSKYPPSFLRKVRLKKIVLTHRLFINGNRTSGGYHAVDQALYLSVSTASAPVDWYNRKMVQHEFSHAIDYTDGRKIVTSTGTEESDPEWLTLQPSGFKFGDRASGFAKALNDGGTGQSYDENLPGFTNKYAAFSPGEDRAETFAFLLLYPEAVLAKAARDPALAKKVKTLKARLKELDPAFDEAFWTRGSADVRSRAGEILEGGRQLLADKSYDGAYDSFELAQSLGHEDGTNGLGVCKLEGYAVKADPAAALSFFRRAEAAGSVKASFNLGTCYENGRGVPRDQTKALAYYRAAAAKGHAGAGEALKRFGTP